METKANKLPAHLQVIIDNPEKRAMLEDMLKAKAAKAKPKFEEIDCDEIFNIQKEVK